MKNLIVAGAVLLVLFVAIGFVYGWIEYRRSVDKTTIDIHTQEMKQDVEEATGKAVGAGKKLIDKTGDSIESAGEELQDDSTDEPSRSEEPSTPSNAQPGPE